MRYPSEAKKRYRPSALRGRSARKIGGCTRMPWTEKYRPTCFMEVKGQAEAVLRLRRFIEEFNLSKLTKKRIKNAIILYGPPGTGKTTLAYVAAQETTSEIFELNASDLRNRQSLDEVLKPSTQQQSLFKKGKIILMDEADGITTTDRKLKRINADARHIANQRGKKEQEESEKHVEQMKL